MKNIIKRLLILFFLNLWTPIFCLSENTLDSLEIKTLSIICAEHQKLSNENALLKSEVSLLDKLVSSYMESDSIYREEVLIYQTKVNDDSIKIQKLEKKQKNTVIGSSIGGIILFIIGLIL